MDNDKKQLKIAVNNDMMFETQHLCVKESKYGTTIHKQGNWNAREALIQQKERKKMTV